MSFVERNSTGKVKATQLINTSYQCQCLQDTFAFIQQSNTVGTVLEWSCMAVSVSVKVAIFTKLFGSRAA